MFYIVMYFLFNFYMSIKMIVLGKIMYQKFLVIRLKYTNLVILEYNFHSFRKDILKKLNTPLKVKRK